MSFFYEHPEEYRQHLTHEGELKPEERAWQTANNTYAFSDGLGVVELIIAALVLANPVSRWLGLAGGVLAFLTPFVTLSFLITTPEVWVMPLGDAHYGFPYLSGAGRLVLKDTLMLAGAVMIMRTPPVRYFYSDSSDPLTLFMPRFVGWRLRHPTMC